MEKKKNKGRPKGAKNKVSGQVKQLMEEWTIGNFEQFKQDIAELEPAERVRLYERIASRFIPRAISEEEAGANRMQSEFLNRLFGHTKE